MSAGFPVALLVPSNWQAVTGSDMSRLKCHATTVGDAVEWLIRRHPELRKRLFAHQADRVASWVNVYLDEHNIRDLDGLATAISGPGTVTILHAVAGG